ncbi:hypothetical protein KFK09_016105 [Dendrobium nobile]|uniref:Uncharacterized protein n=1 Tax=Dendrobium nobile TaxID=94219 RepID=A0A8T3AZS9_DENNO|nr:hypothetical protein KFK09_016105 [Dendrobium nobile]
MTWRRSHLSGAHQEEAASPKGVKEEVSSWRVAGDGSSQILKLDSLPLLAGSSIPSFFRHEFYKELG